MKWSFKDVLLIVGIMVAAIITAVAIIFKDDLSQYTSHVQSLMPEKVSITPVLQKTKKVLFILSLR